MGKNQREKCQEHLVYLSSKKKTSVKSEMKYRNHRQVEYHHTLKRENSAKWRAMDSNLGPLVYEASVLPTELSFRMKN